MEPKLIKITFGQVIKEIRTSQNLSQENLALDCELDRTFVSQIERGIRQPSLTSIFKIAQALNIKPSTIIRRMEIKLK